MPQPALTPMMVQWTEAKSAHPDALLFFRMGDFYELFGDDAVEASRLLELTLTTRDKDKDGGMPMAGVPHHAAQGYLARLVEMGRKVAVCDQLEDPRFAKGIVKRAVTRVVTPGVVVDDISLEPSRNNYLYAVWPGLGGYGVAYADVTTGELHGTLAPDLATIVSELGRIEPREVLVPPGAEASIDDAVRRAGGYRTTLDVADFDARHAPPGAQKAPEEIRRAAGALGAYLARTRPRGDVVLGELQLHVLEEHVLIEETSYRNLEVVKTLVGGRRKGSLLGLLDRTVTAMGARQLRRWLELPLRDKAKLDARLDAVDELVNGALARDDLRTLLGDVYDLERLGGRVTAGLATPKDLANLRRSLGRLQGLRAAMAGLTAPRLRSLAEAMDPLADLHATLEAALADDPALSAEEGRILRDGYDGEVDRLAALARTGKDWLLQYEVDERTRTGISSLKVRYNRVFGYYMEVSRPNLHLVPSDFIRKQTISTGERFFTPALKEYEEKVLTAEDDRVTRETQLFEALRAALRAEAPRLLRTASRVADLDVLCALAEVAHRQGYVRPLLTESGRIALKASRHPVVEATLPAGQFVPNDVVLDTAAAKLLLITGPNMAGKSTIMRQVALIALMAQVGSFVPAEAAEIGLCDRIFTRVGATDDLSRGQSTFMVEMSETAFILKHATARSLIILDEIGRGTSTFDGLSIAWSVAEHIHDHTGARTMFATHYHELCELARTREGVRNVHVAVREWNDEIVFLRRLQEGAVNRSYGIAVGRLAGLPETVLARAREVLAGLEQTDLKEAPAPATAGQLGLFGGPAPATEAAPSDVERALGRVDVSRTTPLEALRLIDKWQKQLKGRG